MVFNKYQWDLYLKAGGQKTVDRFLDFLNGKFDEYPDFVAELVSKFNPDENFVEYYRLTAQDALSEIESYVTQEEGSDVDNSNVIQPENSDADNSNVIQPENSDADNSNVQEPELTQADLISNLWKQIESKYKQSKRKWLGPAFEEACNTIIIKSQALAYINPDCYFPYYFRGAFNVLQAIADTFEIELPEIPGKAQYEDRCRYYGELCIALYDFADKFGLMDEELWAFLYDYAPSCLGGTEWVWNELPNPRNIYVFGCGQYYPEKEPDKIWICQGSAEMQPGDIGLLYHWIPDRCFTSVWRAMAPGFYDPLNVHDRCVCYGKPIEIPKVTLAELKSDEIFSQTSLVKTNMLQMDGAPLLPSEYMHLLDMAAANGALPEGLPTFELNSEMQHGELLVEHDVELQLLEPMLKRLGWTPANWITQMSVRAGRGEHKRPDYVINPITTRNKERGEIVFEAKLTIPNKKQLEEDRGQARSYAKLLSARVCVLVAKEGIWLMHAEDDYSAITAYTWKDLENEDTFSELYNVIGNKQKNTQKRRKK